MDEARRKSALPSRRCKTKLSGNFEDALRVGSRVDASLSDSANCSRMKTYCIAPKRLLKEFAGTIGWAPATTEVWGAAGGGGALAVVSAPPRPTLRARLEKKPSEEPGAAEATWVDGWVAGAGAI